MDTALGPLIKLPDGLLGSSAKGRQLEPLRQTIAAPNRGAVDLHRPNE